MGVCQSFWPPFTAAPWRCWSRLLSWTRQWCLTTHLRQKDSQNSGFQGSSGAYKGQGACQLHQTDGPGLLCCKGPHMHHHCSQGHLHQCGLHREGPGKLHEVSEAEEATDGGRRLVVLLRQDPCPHRRGGAELDGGQGRPGAGARPLFIGSVTSRLLLVHQDQGGAGWPPSVSGGLQDGHGRGLQVFHRRRLRRRLSAVVRPLQ